MFQSIALAGNLSMRGVGRRSISPGHATVPIVNEYLPGELLCHAGGSAFVGGVFSRQKCQSPKRLPMEDLGRGHNLVWYLAFKRFSAPRGLPLAQKCLRGWTPLKLASK